MDWTPVVNAGALASCDSPASEPRWPTREAGTGGLVLPALLAPGAPGYAAVLVYERAGPELPPDEPGPIPTTPPQRQLAPMVETVKAGFGSALSRLSETLGVPSQDLGQWLDGTAAPGAEHQLRFEQITLAAEAFQAAGFKLKSAMLDRSLLRGKSFLELMAEDGADGRLLAEKLMRVVTRGVQASQCLDALLGGRKAKLTPEDFTPSGLDEA